jgi:hypothetical protein
MEMYLGIPRERGNRTEFPGAGAGPGNSEPAYPLDPCFSHDHVFAMLLRHSPLKSARRLRPAAHPSAPKRRRRAAEAHAPPDPVYPSLDPPPRSRYPWALAHSRGTYQRRDTEHSVLHAGAYS